MNHRLERKKAKYLNSIKMGYRIDGGKDAFLALDLIENSLAPLKVIARKAGFSSENSFSSYFKRNFYKLPSDFRRESWGKKTGIYNIRILQGLIKQVERPCKSLSKIRYNIIHTSPDLE